MHNLPAPTFKMDDKKDNDLSRPKGQLETPSSSSRKANHGKKKRKVSKGVPSGSQPRPAQVTQTNSSLQLSETMSAEQSNHSNWEKESLAKLERKALIYQSARTRFRRSLAYHNQKYGRNIQEDDLVKETEVKPDNEEKA